MILMGLALFLVSDGMALPGSAPPVFLAGTEGQYLVLRQPDGALPQWWSVRNGNAQEVNLPRDARVAAPLPDGSGILVIQANRAQRFGWDDGRWGPNGNPKVFEGALSQVQPRLDSAFLQVGDRWLLPVFAQDQLLILECQPEVALVGKVALPELRRHSAWSTGEVTYVAPRPMAGQDGFAWMWGNQFIRWRLNAPNEVQVQDPPPVQNMERAVGLVADGQTFWLVHGGQRGELDSFGWRLLDGKGGTLAQDSGILTRIEWLADSKRPGLAIWTVSQKISSQLYAAISGHRTFSGQRLQWRDGRWQKLAALDLKMGKGKGDSAFALIWTASVDGDNDPDLVAVDEKSGIRAYRGLPEGKVADDEVELGNAPDGILIFEGRLFLANEAGSGWQVKPLEMTP